MAERELRKMRRSELIEIIYALKTREEELTRKKEELEEQLRQREIKLSEAGSIAEAALELNHIFAAAQAAADDYLASVRAMNPQQEEQPQYTRCQPEGEAGGAR